MSKKVYLTAGVILLIAAGLAGWAIWGGPEPRQEEQLEHVTLRLLWNPQAQFAGYIVAHEREFYRDAGLAVEIRSAGPDLMPHVTVATGTDDFGVTVANQIITSRTNAAPLVTIAQLFQDSANRYVLKNKNAINSLQDLRGQTIGLWMHGDEAEFKAMLATEDMKLEDMTVVPQEFSIIPFLEDRYVLSMVTVYNELQLILAQDGYSREGLQILSPRDYGVAIVGDGLFTTEEMIRRNEQLVQDFVNASIRGWKYALEHPDETVDILLDFNPELDRKHQERQLEAVSELVLAGTAKSNGIGTINPDDFRIAAQVLWQSGQISRKPDISACYDRRFWKAVPDELKLVEQLEHE